MEVIPWRPILSTGALISNHLSYRWHAAVSKFLNILNFVCTVKSFSSITVNKSSLFEHQDSLFLSTRLLFIANIGCTHHGILTLYTRQNLNQTFPSYFSRLEVKVLGLDPWRTTIIELAVYIYIYIYVYDINIVIIYIIEENSWKV